jgi:simple sugar transport system permease protein
MSLLTNSAFTAIETGTPVLIAATGELLEERVGVYNVGIEGVMLMGALGGLAGEEATHNVWLGLTAGIGCGMAMALVFGIAVVVFRANMLIAGLAVAFMGTGLSSQWGNNYTATIPSHVVPHWNIPGLDRLPYVGHALFQHLALVYLAAIFPFIVGFLLYRTRHGMNMRAIGENPAAVDAAGISVSFWRMFYILVAGAFAGLAGAFLTLGVVQSWISGVTSGEGWVAIAIVIFAGWRPLPLIFGAYLFGALGTLGNVAQAQGWSIPSELFSALPYLGTLAILFILTWVRAHRRGGGAWPAALGEQFSRA